MPSPLEIGIALHYWTTPGDYDGGTGQHWHSSAVQETFSAFVDRGLIVLNSTGSYRFKRGPALECYVNALCEIPFPIQQWIIPVHPRLTPTTESRQ